MKTIRWRKIRKLHNKHIIRSMKDEGLYNDVVKSYKKELNSKETKWYVELDRLFYTEYNKLHLINKEGKIENTLPQFGQSY